MASKQFRVQVEPEVLRWARTSMGYSPSLASKKLKLEPTDLDALEKGRENPTYGLLLKMSSIYKRPVSALLLNHVPNEKELPNDFRTVGSEELGHFHDKTILAVRKARGLLSAAIELRKELGVPVPGFRMSAEINDDPDAVAIRLAKTVGVRDYWGIENSEEALNGLIERVENLGVFVFQLSLTQDGLRGFSLLDESHPVIVIRRGGEKPTSKIFTLFHELGHIMLGQAGMCDLRQTNTKTTEQWCNQLAAQVLLPLNELLKNAIVKDHVASGDKTWKTSDLSKIGLKYNVGPEVVLRKLLIAGYTTREFYEERRAQWLKNRGGFGKGGRDRVKEVIQERGRAFTRLALSAFDNQKITHKDLLDYLDIKADQIQRVYDQV